MKVIIHDLSPERFERLNMETTDQDIVVSNTGKAKYCIGCL